MSRAASNFAKPQVSEEGVDANLLVSKDLAKMFEEIHQELESEIRYETELTDMSKWVVDRFKVIVGTHSKKSRELLLQMIE